MIFNKKNIKYMFVHLKGVCHKIFDLEFENILARLSGDLVDLNHEKKN